MNSDGARLAADLMDVTVAMRRLVRRRLREEMPPPRLRPAQVELMLVVGRRPGISVAAAARELHLADNSVSTLVNQLIGAQMLRREIDPADRRAARLVLTPAAQRRITEWRDRRARLVGARLDVLSGDDRAAIAAALPALRRLLAEMQEPTSDTESQEPTSDDAREPPSGTLRQ